jgi:hypothetical protein
MHNAMSEPVQNLNASMKALTLPSNCLTKANSSSAKDVVPRKQHQRSKYKFLLMFLIV